MVDGALYRHKGRDILHIPSLLTPTAGNHAGMIILMEEPILDTVLSGPNPLDAVERWLHY